MSSWGYRTFDDDIALDWWDDLLESDPVAFFRHCLDLTDQHELSFLACVGVVCTSEVIIGLTGQPRSGLPVSAKQWCHSREDLRQTAAELIPTAVAALDRVLEETSEMWVRWADLGETHFGTWYDEVCSLRSVLSASWAK